jgi:hypothetical protein
LRRFAPCCWPWEGQNALGVPMCTRSQVHIWRTFVMSSPASSSLNPSWRKRSRNAQTAVPYMLDAGRQSDLDHISDV